MTYTPRPGSTGDLALQHLRAHGPTSASVLAAELDHTENELHSLLAWPMSKGGIKRKVVGDEWVYDVGDGDEIDASQAGPASDGSQKPNGDGHSSSTAPAKAGSNTPQQGANRDASAGQSHGADGSASPTGRGANGASARGAAPVSLTTKPGAQQVLKAEAERPDATDRDAPAHRSPVGGPMGAGQAAAAAPADGLDMDRVGRRNPLQVAADLLRGPDPVMDGEFADPGVDDTTLRCALWSDGVFEVLRGGDAIRFTREETKALVDYLDRVLVDQTDQTATAT
jgi:hypothetical protein